MPEDLYGIGIVPLIIAFVALLRSLGLNPKWGGVVAAALGIAAGFLVYPGEPARSVVVGLALGLSASGLYSTGKAVGEAVRGE